MKRLVLLSLVSLVSITSSHASQCNVLVTLKGQTGFSRQDEVKIREKVEKYLKFKGYQVSGPSHANYDLILDRKDICHWPGQFNTGCRTYKANFKDLFGNLNASSNKRKMNPLIFSTPAGIYESLVEELSLPQCH